MISLAQTLLFHDSQDQFFRKPFGAVPCGKRIELVLAINSLIQPERVFLRLWKYGSQEEKIPMLLAESSGNRRLYRISFEAPERPGLLWYYFLVIQGEETLYYGNNPEQWAGIGQIYEQEPPSYQVTVYQPTAATPHWFKDAVMYQIFVDRFCNGYAEGKILNPKPHCVMYSNWQDTPRYGHDPVTGKTVCYDVFGGNLYGVLKKLPYLKELGVTVIYFNPIFEAASNHKYDTGDYKKIDPMFGDNELFKELCSQAKAEGISIILDGVFSHTGSDSVYFNRENRYPSVGAYQAKDSPYYSWYRFVDWPHQYDCWWDVDTLPNVNEEDPSYQEFIITGEDSVIKYWMKLGVKGWRLDVADELPGAFIKKIRTAMKQTDPESVLIGEVWEDASNKVSYSEQREYLLGEELDSVMNYPFRSLWLDFLTGRQSAQQTQRHLMKLYENYPLEHFYSTMNIIGTHDVERALTLLSDAPPTETLSREEQERYQLTPEQTKLGMARLKLLSLIQMTFPGVPCIYYGDEAGLQGYKDPLNRRAYPWGEENQDLLAWYKKIIALRHQHDALKTGQWNPLILQGQVYGYSRRIEKGTDVFGRTKRNGTLLIIINADVKKEVTLSINVGQWCSGTLVNLLEEGERWRVEDGLLQLSLGPLTGKLLLEEG